MSLPGFGRFSDLDDDQQGCVVFVVVVLLFLISAFVSFRELRYALGGSTVDAATTSANRVEVSSTRGRRRVVTRVSYTFSAGDDAVSGNQDLAEDWTPPSGAPLRIDYLRSDPQKNRIHGERSLLPIWFFLGCLVLVVVSGVRVVRQAKTDVARSRR